MPKSCAITDCGVDGVVEMTRRSLITNEVYLMLVCQEHADWLAGSSLAFHTREV